MAEVDRDCGGREVSKKITQCLFWAVLRESSRDDGFHSGVQFCQHHLLKGVSLSGLIALPPLSKMH